MLFKVASTLALIAGLSVSFPSYAQSQDVNVGREAIPEKDLTNIAIARQLFKAGALRLSLSYLNAHPPSVAVVDIWKIWAEQKWNIYIQLEDWGALKSDAKGLPASFGAASGFSIAYQARAAIELGELGEARRLLQSSLRSKDLPLRLQKEIRAQLISLYFAQEDYVNAKIEAIRFHDEFKPHETKWFIQRATIEYLADDASGAGQILAAIASIEAKLLQTLFRFSANEIDSEQALAQLAQQLGRKQITTAERKLAFGIKAKILSHETALERQTDKITALEQYLSIEAPQLHSNFIAVTPTKLKEAYIQLSDTLINQALEDPSRSSLKFELAQRLEQANTSTRARALFLDVTLDKHDESLSQLAKNQYVRNLIETDHFKLLSALFGAGKMFQDFSHIEPIYNAKILNYALAEGNANLIAEIAPFLSTAPDNTDPLDWMLQKARIDIFTGQFDRGREKVIEWLGEKSKLSGQEVDRVLQAVFDLQAVKQDEIALALFNQISSQTDSKRHKREILFWKAQSYDAMDGRKKAAELYLRSAMVSDSGYDQWGHSARFHAASTLMEAGEYHDASRLFKDLLTVTSDVSRRATIKQALQRLWLLENHAQ